MKTRTEIRYEGDEAKELVLAATGSPFLILVEDEDGGLLLKRNGIDNQTIVDLIVAMAEHSNQFRDELADYIIEISKALRDGKKE